MSWYLSFFFAVQGISIQVLLKCCMSYIFLSIFPSPSPRRVLLRQPKPTARGSEVQASLRILYVPPIQPPPTRPCWDDSASSFSRRFSSRFCLKISFLQFYIVSSMIIEKLISIFTTKSYMCRGKGSRHAPNFRRRFRILSHRKYSISGVLLCLTNNSGVFRRFLHFCVWPLLSWNWVCATIGLLLLRWAEVRDGEFSPF